MEARSASQSGPDIAPQPVLLPPAFGEHAERNCLPRDVLRRTPPEEIAKNCNVKDCQDCSLDRR